MRIGEMRDYYGVLEIRKADGSLHDAMLAATRRAKRKPKEKERVIGNTFSKVRYFNNTDDLHNYYSSLKAELLT